MIIALKLTVMQTADHRTHPNRACTFLQSDSQRYRADHANGVVLGDVTDPENLKQCGFFRIPGVGGNTTLAGPLIFLCVTDLIDRRNLSAILQHRH